MGEVDLPLIPGAAEIDAALDVMRDRQRSGLVTIREGKPVVLTDQDLIEGARARRQGLVRDVQPAHRTIELSRDIPRFRAALAPGARAEREELFVAEYAHFFVERVPGEMIRVHTVAEVFARALGQPVVRCTCTKCGTRWRKTELHKDGECNLDGARVDCK